MSNFQKLSDREEELGKIIVDCAYKIHTQLGPGLLEKIYEVCLAHELKKLNIPVERQVSVPIIYDGIKFEEAYRLDLLVDNLVICEIKSVEQHNKVWNAQLLSHLKLLNKRLGYLINFNVSLIKDGIKRIVH